MSSAQRTATIILGVLLAMLLARWLYISVSSIAKVNDFEVFHHIGEVAATHDPGIYQAMSPVKQRGPFLYPPSAAVLFVPLAWLPHDVSGAAFSVLKLTALVLLIWGSVRWSGCQPRDALGTAIVAGFVLAILFRPINSDVGNGQINILTGVLGIGGIWLIMTGRRKWCLVGALSIAVATAIKLTPALLLAVPVLHRRWWAVITSVGFSAILMIALPAVWFGAENLRPMLREHSRITSEFTMNWPAVGRQVTLNEAMQFARAQSRIDRLHPDVIASSDDASPVRGFNPGEFLEDGERRQATLGWVACGLAVGAAFLALRWTLSRNGPGRGRDWTWDLAMMCLFTVLLSPRVHKAHLVVLIPPVAWVTARVVHRVGAEGADRSAAIVAAYAVLVALFIAAENWAMPVPGWPLAAHPGLLIGLLLMGTMLAIIHGSRRPAEAIDPAAN